MVPTWILLMNQGVLALGVIAVGVNEWLKRRHERKLRDRDYRRQVYVNFITATSARFAPRNPTEASELEEKLEVALATMRITSTTDVTSAAESVVGFLLNPDMQVTGEDKIERTLSLLRRSELLKKPMVNFIEAARYEDERG